MHICDPCLQLMLFRREERNAPIWHVTHLWKDAIRALPRTNTIQRNGSHLFVQRQYRLESKRCRQTRPAMVTKSKNTVAGSEIAASVDHNNHCAPISSPSIYDSTSKPYRDLRRRHAAKPPMANTNAAELGSGTPTTVIDP